MKLIKKIISGLKKLFFIIVFPFFGKNNRIKPNRAFITIFLCLIIDAINLKLKGCPYLSDTFIIALMSQVSVLLGLDTWRSNFKDKNNVEHNKEI